MANIPFDTKKMLDGLLDRYRRSQAGRPKKTYDLDRSDMKLYEHYWDFRYKMYVDLMGEAHIRAINSGDVGLHIDDIINELDEDDIAIYRDFFDAARKDTQSKDWTDEERVDAAIDLLRRDSISDLDKFDHHKIYKAIMNRAAPTSKQIPTKPAAKPKKTKFPLQDPRSIQDGHPHGDFDAYEHVKGEGINYKYLDNVPQRRRVLKSIHDKATSLLVSKHPDGYIHPDDPAQALADLQPYIDEATDMLVERGREVYERVGDDHKKTLHAVC